jgi:hypothetical protein
VFIQRCDTDLDIFRRVPAGYHFPEHTQELAHTIIRFRPTGSSIPFRDSIATQLDEVTDKIAFTSPCGCFAFQRYARLCVSVVELHTEAGTIASTLGLAIPGLRVVLQTVIQAVIVIAATLVGAAGKSCLYESRLGELASDKSNNKTWRHCRFLWAVLA